MAEYGLPLHAQTMDGRYMMDDRYHDNSLSSPHDLGPWMEDQSDGGKFRLKRRRRCGQCGPCQVKENCGKCQYCVRKDVLKQACIYRKCVYLRKPVPRFRPEAAGSGVGGSVAGVPGSGLGVGGSGGSGGGGGDATGSSSSSSVGSSSTSLNKTSPQKPPSTPSMLTSHHATHPTPPFNAAMAAAAAAVQSAEMSSSCQLAQNTFRLPMNNRVIDPLRTSALEQHRNALFDAASMLDPSRAAYLSGAHALEPGRSPALDLGRNTGTADSGLGTSGSSLPTSPASQTKDRPMPREQYRSPMEQWGANLPYFPRNPWGYPALQPSPAAYGFQSGAAPFASPFASSCRLGMPDPTSHFTTPPQPTFPHNMPFPRPDLTASANFAGSGPPMQPTMTPPFYAPPPHIPSSLPNFPSFNQLPSSASGHGTLAVPHPPMYPGNFCPTFRPHSEPHTYHARLLQPELPFLGPHGLGSRLEPLWDKHHRLRKGSVGGDEGENGNKRKGVEYGDDLLKKFSIFHIPKCTHFSTSTLDRLTEPFDRTKFGREDGGTPLAHRHSVDFSLDGETHRHSVDSLLDIDKVPVNSVHHRLPPPAKELSIDKDLRQQLECVMGRKKCDFISIDDFKMHAFIHADNFNNLEIEIDDPCSPSNMALNSPHYQDHSPQQVSGSQLRKHHLCVTNSGNGAQKRDERDCVRELQNRNMFAKKHKHKTYSALRQQNVPGHVEKRLHRTDLQEMQYFSKIGPYRGYSAQKEPNMVDWMETLGNQSDLHEQQHKRSNFDEAQERGESNLSTYSGAKSDQCLGVGVQNDWNSNTQLVLLHGTRDVSEDKTKVHDEILAGSENGTTTSTVAVKNCFAHSQNWTGCVSISSTCRHDVLSQRRDSFGGGNHGGLVVRRGQSLDCPLSLSPHECVQARSAEHHTSLSDSVTHRSRNPTEDHMDENLSPPSVVVQDCGEGGDDAIEVEMPGSRVQVDVVVANEDILNLSDPDSLLQCISCHDHPPLSLYPNLDSSLDTEQMNRPRS